MARRRSSALAIAWYLIHGFRVAFRVCLERQRPGPAVPGRSYTRSPELRDVMTTDIRQSLRFLARRPLLSLSVIITVALAVSATTTVFAVVDGVLLEPLPYASPDRLVAIWETNPAAEDRNVVSPANFLTWRDELESFDAISSILETGTTIIEDGVPERVGWIQASADYFEMVGAGAVVGRLYSQAEDQPGGGNVVVLSEGFWQRRFGADPTVVGRTIQLGFRPGGALFEVIGVFSWRLALRCGCVHRNDASPLAMTHIQGSAWIVLAAACRVSRWDIGRYRQKPLLARPLLSHWPTTSSRRQKCLREVSSKRPCRSGSGGANRSALMKIHKSTMFVAMTAMLAMAACDDTPTTPDFDADNSAVVEGRVDETTPSQSSAAGPQKAPGTAAQTVSVVQISSSGEYSELASADVQADGTYRVDSVPAGRTNTAVVAYVDGRAAGEVLIHSEIESQATVRAAPITYETTMQTRAYARVVASGRADQTSSTELALFLHANGSELEALLASDAELDAVADGSAEASATMNEIFADAGVSLDASTRSDLMVDAAVNLAADLLGGLSLEAAHDRYADAAIDAWAGAGARLETIVMATAGAASTLDAAVEGRTTVRGRIITEPVLFNLRARERAAVQHESSAEASLAAAIEASLVDARAGVEATSSTAADVKSELETRLSATIDAASDAAVELLAAGSSTTVRANVRAAAETALTEATLNARLEGAASASAAASAMADYRASVRSAVQAMVDAAGDTSADVDVITELFIAACGGAYIR